MGEVQMRDHSYCMVYCGVSEKRGWVKHYIFKKKKKKCLPIDNDDSSSFSMVNMQSRYLRWMGSFVD